MASAVRSAAVAAFVRSGEGSAVEPLIGALDDSQHPVRQLAAEALSGLFSSGRLDDNAQRLVLANRKKIPKLAGYQSPAELAVAREVQMSNQFYDNPAVCPSCGSRDVRTIEDCYYDGLSGQERYTRSNVCQKCGFKA